MRKTVENPNPTRASRSAAPVYASDEPLEHAEAPTDVEPPGATFPHLDMRHPKFIPGNSNREIVSQNQSNSGAFARKAKFWVKCRL